ncbi:hypothetical protein DY000_02013528 [Brassica cretica]|uniref:Uncharacterized protein n=1 Tax=Brassica cretica TaxID=69181 RepID=A0ABQ7CVZ7_BRACR|nr:hypothetical protein DY000_02013528 [Brassica cretica]
MTSGDDGGREDGGNDETISSSDGGNDRLERKHNIGVPSNRSLRELVGLKVEKAATAYVFAASDSHVSEAH